MDTLLSRLKSGLARTRNNFVSRIDELCSPDLFGEDPFELLEETLISADIGVNASLEILDNLRNTIWTRKPDKLQKHLKDAIYNILKGCEGKREIDTRPFVIMALGVNGAGKTTTIGKLAKRYTVEGKRVILAACDTFRDAAIEQLEIWGERTGCDVIRQRQGGDPGAVAFDAVRASLARGADILIMDTAGRLHTKVNLMEELKKIKRVVGKELPGAPHENLLVLDASTGQNAISQAQTFNEAVGVTGIALTKLDGTAKGGVIVAIAKELKIPIRFIGIGEGVFDLRDFNAKEFAEALI